MSIADIGVNPPKGFRDILPQETELRDSILNTILAVYRSYGFERVETPIVEDLRRLQHSEGGENLGLLFKILKRGEKLDLTSAAGNPDTLADLALRYDLTVPLSRYYAAHRGKLPPVFKAVQIGPVFRAERPQQGRFRQFVQCDIDVIGGTAPLVETELILVTTEALSKVGISGAKVRLNDRRILTGMVAHAGIPSERTGLALVILDKLDKLGQDGVRQAYYDEGFEVEQVEALLEFTSQVSALPEAERLSATMKLLGQRVPAEVGAELEAMVKGVQASIASGCSLSFDPFLVRGMGYYTGAVFEISHPDFSGSVAGGGRYDKLVGKLSGTDAPACGFSIGFERIASLLLDQAVKAESERKNKVAVFVPQEAQVGTELMQQIHQLQQAGSVVSLFELPKNLKHSLERLKLAGYTSFGRYQTGQALALKQIE